MCVSMRHADFSGTTVYLGETVHPQHGLIHVLGYQNRAVSFAGPNALLLHLPARSPMRQGNFIDTTSCPQILDDMVKALQPRTRGATFRAHSLVPGGVEVFDVGIYTVVLASNPARIPDALQHVPAHKRPAVNRPLCDFYAHAFPNWSVALCCFNNVEVRHGEPLLLWYAPMEQDIFRLPALDCHTGAVPEGNALVEVDHWLVIGSHRMAQVYGRDVMYRGTIPPAIRPFLPTRVMGRRFRGRMQNGDFGVPAHDVLAGRLDRVLRLPPPSA